MTDNDPSNNPPSSEPSNKPIKRKREKSNCKSVELMDLEGNVLQVYPSGIAMATALGIQQGDISLCCRGLKYSVGNYRFRFHGDTEDQYEVMQRRKKEMREQALTVPKELKDSFNNPEPLSRTRRRTTINYGDMGLGEYGEATESGVTHQSTHTKGAPPNLNNVKEVKVRKWRKDTNAKVGKGTFTISRWVPQGGTNPAFKAFLPKKTKKKRYERRKSHTYDN
mmetsp:Transcript_25081/g.36984  ORF Transcript_25081/g.36984 Transcript_25081/m.36984 type:complete len:223 (+) Transcript_25081:42-710(+)